MSRCLGDDLKTSDEFWVALVSYHLFLQRQQAEGPKRPQAAIGTKVWESPHSLLIHASEDRNSLSTTAQFRDENEKALKGRTPHRNVQRHGRTMIPCLSQILTGRAAPEIGPDKEGARPHRPTPPSALICPDYAFRNNQPGRLRLTCRTSQPKQLWLAYSGFPKGGCFGVLVATATLCGVLRCNLTMIKKASGSALPIMWPGVYVPYSAFSIQAKHT